MVLHAGRGGGELRHELGVHQEALGQVAQLGRADRAQDLGQPRGHAVDLVGPQHEEIGFVDFVRPGAADRVGDQLHVALEELRVAVDLHVVAVLERAVVVLAGVPEPGGDRAAAVGKLQLQIEIAVAIRAELLIGGQKHLAHLFVVAKLADITSFGRRWTWRESEVERSESQRAENSRELTARRCLAIALIVGQRASTHNGRATRPRECDSPSQRDSLRMRPRCDRRSRLAFRLSTL